ncbi:hypothetical protein MKW92_017443, partial [Papaver armeniacum]
MLNNLQNSLGDMLLLSRSHRLQHLAVNSVCCTAFFGSPLFWYHCFKPQIFCAESDGKRSNGWEGKKRKRKDKEVVIFGNYRHYYGYRDMKADPRLMVLKKEWFEDKDCLHIGCNQGLITIEIAKTFHCRSILGVDIDASLIESAYWNLKKVDKMESAGCPSQISSEEGKRDHPKSLLDIVSFQKQNCVHHFCKHSDDEKYDAVTCFNLTKWIHLNWGDEGLITSFRNILRLLRPSLNHGSHTRAVYGILVLEPQPWKSYKSNNLVSE